MVRVLRDRRIVLGVTGSIAVYKALDFVRQLTQAGAQVDVVMTEEAQAFVTALTFQT
ncbi:MAG: bifunctional 4'-phosphopantothenoylcysteine decarboxylase/phosphopantothenoylcysteine synthetase, partial [Chloroflexi bacterium]|nr:bifunctional 4'-phosphopantothenoylcysteine decarboxylase/phosphopantothenoylcysteine synthetase [Chloroflexota bacterium]